jgi:hypothetical protein
MAEFVRAREDTTMSLLEALTRAFQEASSTRITAGDLGLIDALNSANYEVSATAAVQLHKLASGLSELAQKETGFPGESVRMVRRDGGASGFYPNFIGIPLIRRALKTGSPEEAISWLEKVLSTSTATGKVVAVLWGAPVVNAIQLTAEVKIVPLAELPESAQKQWIVNHSILGAGSPVTSMLEFSAPQSALLVWS